MPTRDLELTACPECGAPAEVTERYEVASTAGPVAMRRTSCVARHHIDTEE